MPSFVDLVERYQAEGYSADIISQLTFNRQGEVIPNLANTVKLLSNQPIWFDEFSQKVFINDRALCDDDIIRQQRNLTNGIMSRADKSTVRDALRLVALDNARNPLKEHIESVVWDGVPRIAMTFPTYFGTTDDEYHRAVGANWWISMIARIYSPGCQCDNMVVLEGEQGAGKSTALSVIGGDWYTNLTKDITGSDMPLHTMGYFLIEIGELDAFNKADAARIKNLVTNREDVFRRPYASFADAVKRAFVMDGTTNNYTWGTDQTGLRRFWPVRVQEINLDPLTNDRHQLFAEALQAYRDGQKWYVTPPHETASHQGERLQEDPWEYPIIEWLKSQRIPFPMHNIFVEALQMPIERAKTFHSGKIGALLRKLGYDPLRSQESNQRSRLWRHPDWDKLGPNDAF